MIRSSASINPGTYVISSLLLTVAIGTILLSLPICQKASVSVVDAFLAAVSAATVTGLMAIPMESFNSLGKLVMMILMQLGGLGLMTMSLFAISLIMELGISTQFIVSELLELEAIKNIKRTLLFIIGITLVTELLGTILLVPFFLAEESCWWHALLYSLFHSISAFCNAGLVLPQTAQLLMNHQPYFLTVTIILMMSGGLGFLTWHELYRRVREWKRKRGPFKLSLHSKIVLQMAALLLIGGTLLILALEWNNQFVGLSWPHKLLVAVFNAVSMKSTGFLTSPLKSFQLATIFVMLCLSLIGSSPGSTGSGLKTTTVAILAATTRTVLYGSTDVHIAKRSISKQQVFKSVAILVLSMLTLMAILFGLLVTQTTSLLQNIVEAVSSVTNLGVTTGTLADHTTIGKLLLSCGMIIGRVGTYTLALSFIAMHRTEVTYPEERVMLT